MSDLEQLLRDYGRDTDARARPVTIDEISSRPLPAGARGSGGFATLRRGRGLMLVAAGGVLVVGVGVVVGRLATTDTMRERPPAESVVSDPFVTLPEPTPTTPVDPIDEVMETSIGSISWTRVDGDPAAMPRRVTGRDGDTLIGDDWDPTVSWTSTDGGESWQRSQSDGTRTQAGGHDWVNRGRELGQSRLARTTADGEIDVAVDRSILDVPDGWNMFTFHSDPVDLGGDAFVLTTTRVRADLDAVAAELGVAHLMFPDWTRHSVEDGYGNVAVAPDSELRVELVTRPGSRVVDLVDPTGDVVATFDAAIEPLNENDPTQMVTVGASASQWSVFDGEEFVALDVPWPVTSHPIMVSVGDAVMIVVSGAAMTEPAPTSVWATTDGHTWDNVTPGDPAGSRGAELTELTTTDDRVIIGLADQLFITADGYTFESLSTPPATGSRHRSDVGWVTIEIDAATMWVSPDGDKWEPHSISQLHGLVDVGFSPDGKTNVIDSTIYIILKSGRDQGGGTLLTGEITTTP